MGESSELGRNKHVLLPKPESLDYDLPCDTSYSRQIGNGVASSSRSNVRSLLVEMGFSQSLIESTIEEKGEDNVDLLVETLIEYSGIQNSQSRSKDYSKSPHIEKDTSRFSDIPVLIRPKQEPDAYDEVDDKRSSLLIMNFPVNFVDFALDKLGKDAPIEELVDFIVAAQIAETFEEESELPSDGAEDYDEASDGSPVGDAQKVQVSDEHLFETMDKTLHLLEMGFSDHEVSLAIEKLGSKGEISELTDTIFMGGVPPDIPEKEKKHVPASEANPACLSKNWRFVGVGRADGSKHQSGGPSDLKTEDSVYGLDPFSRPTNGSPEKRKGLKDEDDLAYPDASSFPSYQGFTDYDIRGKRPKLEEMDGSSSFFEPTWLDENDETKVSTHGIPKAIYSRNIEKAGTKPYFFYGNFANISSGWWTKISEYLFTIPPEFVNTRAFSALNRGEGYVHNLPIENRFHVLQKPLTTIQDVLPQTKKWWPSWDTRKRLNSINPQTVGVSQLCDRLGNILVESRGLLSPQQQNFFLHHCHTSNLLWVAPNILSPTEPEHLERILGYPAKHTHGLGISFAERLKMLAHCFQIDTLGYHLSSLKKLYPGGITLLSLFSGLGGVEVALARLGIHLKGVVSVEPCELSRRVLKKWWQTSGQSGELMQLDGIKGLSTKKLEVMMERFGGFDLIACQNPLTPSDLSKESRGMNLDGNNQPQDFDFTLFYEFVRVVVRIKSMAAARS